MSARHMWFLASAALTSFALVIFLDPTSGWEPLGDYTHDAQLVAAAIGIGITGFSQGYQVGERRGIQSGCDQCTADIAEQQAAINQLVQLVEAGRIDVENALRAAQAGYPGVDPEVVRDHLTSVVEDGSLSLAAQNRAVAGLPFDQTQNARKD